MTKRKQKSPVANQSGRQALAVEIRRFIAELETVCHNFERPAEGRVVAVEITPGAAARARLVPINGHQRP